MKGTGRVKVTTEVTEDCWIELKVLAVRRKVSLQVAVSEILERAMSKRLKGSNEVGTKE